MTCILIHRSFSIRSGDCQHSLEGHHDQISTVSVSSNGKYIMSVGHDGQIILRSTDGGLINEVEGPGRLLNAGFNANDDTIVVTSYASVEMLKLKFNPM